MRHFKASVFLVMLIACGAPHTAAADSPTDSTLLHSARLSISADMDSTAIFLDGRIVGYTPCILDSVPPGSHKLLGISRAAASWYAKLDSLTVILSPGETRQVNFLVMSQLRFGTIPVPEISSLLRDDSGSGGRKIGMYISGGVAIAAGIAAAYLKITADGQNEAYLATRETPYLEERRRLDTAAGIAFAITQVSFALFSYLLQSE
jgi:hypothetical protein